jgi:hypothetical protein
MFAVNHDDPLSTAAAALALAEALLPDLEAAVPDLLGDAAAADLARLAGRMAGARLFDDGTLPPLRRLLAAAEAGVARETGDAVIWVPVGYAAGMEEFEQATVTRRTPRGDAFADIAGRLRRLVALIERTEALLAAERALARRRYGAVGVRRGGAALRADEASSFEHEAPEWRTEPRPGDGADRAGQSLASRQGDRHERRQDDPRPPWSLCPRASAALRSGVRGDRAPVPGTGATALRLARRPFVAPGPEEAERIRWLLVAMARARATPGGEVIARLALRGYAISTRLSLPGPHVEVLALDEGGFVHLGHILPSSCRPWKRVEQAALGIDPEAYPARRWCSAHESLAIRAALEREGHVFD